MMMALFPESLLTLMKCKLLSVALPALYELHNHESLKQD